MFWFLFGPDAFFLRTVFLFLLGPDVFFLLVRKHGCCWEAFYIFVYCGLVRNPLLTSAKKGRSPCVNRMVNRAGAKGRSPSSALL